MALTGTDTRKFSWLLDDFVERTHGVRGAVAVSSDGLLMALSRQVDRTTADQLAAVISGMVSLGHGASRFLDTGALDQVIIAFQGGYLLLASIADGSCLGVIGSARCDLGLVGYEMAILSERAGSVLTPALVAQLKAEVHE